MRDAALYATTDTLLRRCVVRKVRRRVMAQCVVFLSHLHQAVQAAAQDTASDFCPRCALTRCYYYFRNGYFRNGMLRGFVSNEWNDVAKDGAFAQCTQVVEVKDKLKGPKDALPPIDRGKRRKEMTQHEMKTVLSQCKDKLWHYLISTVPNYSDYNVNIVADFILSLLIKDGNEAQLRNHCQLELRIGMRHRSEEKQLVNELFKYIYALFIHMD